MTSPNNNPAPSDQGDSQPPARRVRAGQIVTFTHPDPITGRDLTGHGLVLTAAGPGETAVVAPLGVLHLQVLADNLAPVKAEDVPTPITQPTTD